MAIKPKKFTSPISSFFNKAMEWIGERSISKWIKSWGPSLGTVEEKMKSSEIKAKLGLEIEKVKTRILELFDKVMENYKIEARIAGGKEPAAPKNVPDKNRTSSPLPPANGKQELKLSDLGVDKVPGGTPLVKDVSKTIQSAGEKATVGQTAGTITNVQDVNLGSGR